MDWEESLLRKGAFALLGVLSPVICEVVFDEMALAVFPLVDDGFNLKYTKSYRRIGGKVLVLLPRMNASIQDPRQTPLVLAERL